MSGGNDADLPLRFAEGGNADVTDAAAAASESATLPAPDVEMDDGQLLYSVVETKHLTADMRRQVLALDADTDLYADVVEVDNSFGVAVPFNIADVYDLKNGDLPTVKSDFAKRVKLRAIVGFREQARLVGKHLEMSLAEAEEADAPKAAASKAAQ